MSPSRRRTCGLLDLVAGRCQGADVFRLSSEVASVAFENGELKTGTVSQSSGTALRVVTDGRVSGAVGSGDVEPAALADMALSTAPWGPARSLAFPGPARLRRVRSWDEAEAELSVEDLVALGRRLVGKLRRRWPELACGAGVGRGLEEVHLENSAGFRGALRATSFSAGCSVSAARPGDLFHWSASMHELPDDRSLEAFLERCHERIALGLRVAELAPGTYPVVLSPDAMPFLLRVLEAGVSAHDLHERRSPLVGRQGERVLSERFTLLDDPTWGRTGRTVPFDDEGVPCRKRALFDRGVFAGPMTDLEHAAKLGIEPTGHGFREKPIYRGRALASGVSISPTNWRIAPGRTALSALLGSVSRGVYVEMSGDCWMGNVASGTFTGTLHQAYLIEGGKLVGRLKHRSFSGNLYQVLGERLADVSREVERPTMGFDTYESPHLLISAMEIS